MKTSNTKRMLAFWLAIAILGTPVSGALASERTAVQTAASQTEENPTEAKQITLASVTVENKVYDGTTAADPKAIQVKFSDTASEPIRDTDYTVSGIFGDANVGAKQTVTVTVTLTEEGKKKYIFANNKTEEEIAKNDVAITPANLDVKVSAIEVEQDATLDDIQQAIHTTASGVNNKPVAGQLTLTGVSKKTASRGEISLDHFTATPGTYEVTAKFVPDDKNYNEKTDVTFGCTVNAKETPPAEKQEQEASFPDTSAHTYEKGGSFENRVKIQKGNTSADIVYDSSEKSVATIDNSGTISILKAGQTKIRAVIAGDATYAPKTLEYTLVINPKDLSSTATIADIADQAYTGTAITPDIKLQNAEGLVKDTDYTVTYENNTAVGTATAIVTFQGNYSGTVKKTFKITQSAPPVTSVSVSVLKNKTYTFDLPEEISKLTDVSVTLKEQPEGGTVIESASVANKKLTVKTKADASGTENIVLTITSKDSADFELTYKLTVVNKTDVSDHIQFADETVPYDKQPHKLKNASLTDITAGENAKWTYTWTKTKAITDTMPEFTDAGVYEVTATYEDDKNFGQKTATLTIQKTGQQSSITVSASQLSRSSDNNYYNFSLRTRDESAGYTRIRAEANDYLNRQSINDTYSEWIGMEITPKIDGSTMGVQDLYASTNGTSWSQLSRGTYGDFYIESVSGSSFSLWYDTDDHDCSNNLYLATDRTGANKFQLRVDFYSYSRDSSGGSSGSTSSSTNKVNGSKVSTTTIDKSPSVKNGSATVSISRSALSDALDKNKREAKYEKADKTFIELDVKTSSKVDDTTITVPVHSLDNIADENTGLSLVTNQGTIQMDHRALAQIVSTSDKSDVSFSIQEDKSNQYTLMVKNGSSKIIDLGSGEAELTFSYKLKSGEKASDVKVYRVGDGSKTWLSSYGGSTVYGGTGTYAAATGSYVTNMNANYNASKKTVTLSTDALGTFLVTTDNLQTGSTSNPVTPSNPVKPSNPVTPSNPSYPSNSTFIDVPNYHWSAPYINKLASLGIINGTGGGWFEPTLYVSREEFVKMLAGVAGANVSGYTSQPFPDVPAYRWSAPYISWAADHMITTSTDGGRFAPTMKITREEMATMIYRYTQSAGKVLPTKNIPIVFADTHRIENWARTPVSIMQQAGIIDGNVVNSIRTFDPKLPATREECAKMLCLLYDLI